jgi:acetoin utilization deacetylase AcuC-like enzyme
MRFGLVLDPLFADHKAAYFHPERPDRIHALVREIASLRCYSRLKLFHPTPAKEEWILAVHGASHLNRVRETAKHDQCHLDPDTYAGRASFQTAMMAAGSAVGLTRELMQGRIQSGMALVRPPGHHARIHQAMGFCLFNNVAVAAQWALREGQASRVAVVDFDVHHGNGIQEIFYARPDVLYISQHQYPFYPGSGSFQEQGEGAGRGFTVNFPLRAGRGDFFYWCLFRDFVGPILERYRPDLILVSAGYDAHAGDPLGGMKLTDSGFGAIVNSLNAVAREVCGGRILYVLEGGYSLDFLVKSVAMTIETTVEPRELPLQEDQQADYEDYRMQALEHLEQWKI